MLTDFNDLKNKGKEWRGTTKDVKWVEIGAHLNDQSYWWWGLTDTKC